MAQKKPLSPELKALHRKFIPGNIIICIIALVAGFCMLFMPWLDLRIHIDGEAVAKIISEQSSDNSSNGEESFKQTLTGSLNGNSFDISVYSIKDVNYTETSMEEGTTSSGTKALTDALAESLKGESFDIPINLYPMKMVSAASGGKAEVEEFFNSIIGKSGAETFLNDFVNKIAPVVVKASLNTSIEQMFDEMGNGLTPEEKEMVEQYKKDVNDALDNISKNPTTENAKVQLNNVVDNILGDEKNDMTEAELRDIRNVIDEFVNQASNDGKFDYVHLIKNLDIEAIENAINGNTEPDNGLQNNSIQNDAGALGLFETTSSGSSSSSEENPLKDVIEMLENPGSLVAENLDDEIVSMLSIVFWVIFGVFVAFPAFLCFLLAILAFVRIFTEKKRVKYWYVKTILFISTLFLIALNVLAKVVLPKLNLGPDASSIFSAFSMTFLGSSVVKAVCWGLLFLFSLFYYRRIKKKVKLQIRKENEMALAVENGEAEVATSESETSEN